MKISIGYNDLMKKREDALPVLLAITLLEYHDKNFLTSISPRAMTEAKTELIMRAMSEKHGRVSDE